MILQTDVADVLSRPSIRIDGTGWLRRHRVALLKVGYLHSVQKDNRVRAIEHDFQCVPFAKRVNRAGQRFRKCIEDAGAGIIVRLITDFDFVAAVHGHPRLSGLFWNANKDA